MEPIQFIKELGFPFAVIAGVAWFVSREVWPFAKQRIEAAHSDRLAQNQQFFDTLSKFAELVTTQRQATLTTLAQLTDQMEAITHTLSNVVHLVEALHTRTTEQRRTPRQH
jgi:septal ring factor EnvC (AmiA/AmiB activator)